ncbi:MAG: hypothetical protein M1834_000590 [Cirrosporium novae-zelandiae]|nr:MAG: hypothetical protein M1834_000590 [Cirrosporium novae-zelandiae]
MHLRILVTLISLVLLVNSTWTSIKVKSVTEYGSQTSNVTSVSRDGGSSVLINNRIIWLYDDTESLSTDGDQLAFVSNSAAYANAANENIRAVEDYEVIKSGKDKNGNQQWAIIGNVTAPDGRGWIPLLPQEVEFNNQSKGLQRLALWPGANPTPINGTSAFLFTPIVLVTVDPSDPSGIFQSDGMALISLSAPSSGPLATRIGSAIFLANEVPFGGFASILGTASLSTASQRPSNDQDVYLLGKTDYGLQLARVPLTNLSSFNAYTFFDPLTHDFTTTAPNRNTTSASQLYLSGSFSSGSLFYSPYFSTFILIYFTNLADSTFYVRFLDLSAPLNTASEDWPPNGKNGTGISASSAEALAHYAWSPPQPLYKSPPGTGGYNYAAFAHPEYFNRQYFPPSFYIPEAPTCDKRNEWFGTGIISESAAGGDGKHILLSWTEQEAKGSIGYQIKLVKVEFDAISYGKNGIMQPKPNATNCDSSRGYVQPSKGSISRPPSLFLGGEYAFDGNSGIVGLVGCILGVLVTWSLVLWR